MVAGLLKCWNMGLFLVLLLQTCYFFPLQPPGHSAVEVVPPMVQVHSSYQPFHPTSQYPSSNILTSYLLTELKQNSGLNVGSKSDLYFV